MCSISQQHRLQVRNLSTRKLKKEHAILADRNSISHFDCLIEASDVQCSIQQHAYAVPDSQESTSDSGSRADSEGFVMHLNKEISIQQSRTKKNSRSYFS
jgi:hypothetical protein